MSRYTCETTFLMDTLAALEKAGWKPFAVDDGGDEVVPVGSAHEAAAAAAEVGDALVLVRNSSGQNGGVRTVFGNAPEEVIADYTTAHGLGDLLDEILDRFLDVAGPEETLRKIAEEMSGKEWDSDTLDRVAELVRSAGYEIAPKE